MPNGFLGPKPSYHAPKRTACRSGIAPFRTHDCMNYDGAARKTGCGCTDHVKRTMSTSDDLRCSELNHWPKKISSTVPSLVDAQHPPRCRPGCELERVSWSVSLGSHYDVHTGMTGERRQPRMHGVPVRRQILHGSEFRRAEFPTSSAAPPFAG
jgi:hypothetical protein